MTRHGWKVGLLAAAICLTEAVSHGQAAPPVTQASVVPAATGANSQGGIEPTGYRRRMRRMEQQMQQGGSSPSQPSVPYSSQPGPSQPGAAAVSGAQAESYAPATLPPGSQSVKYPAPPLPPAPEDPAPTPAPRTISTAQRRMPRVQPSNAEVAQQGMYGYPEGYCPQGCPTGDYPVGYCPAGNCDSCCCDCQCCAKLRACFHDLTTFRHCKIHAMNPGYIDDRDTTYYSAQGYGLPIVVPMAPNVRYQYNYGWGLPSSRITKVPYGFPQYYPQQFHSMAGSPQVQGEHPPMVYWPTDTTQLGVYGRRVPTWVPRATVP